jgi:copper chaperone CopZ
MTNQHTFYSDQIHCRACEFLLENELKKDSRVTKVEVDTTSKKILIDTQEDLDSIDLSKDLTKPNSDFN